MTALLDRIAAIVGTNSLLTGADAAARPADWLGFTHCQAQAVVRPASPAELSAVMQACHAAGQSVVPAGGLTGLVHGADTVPADIQISFDRMRAIDLIDPVGRTVTVQAGCPIQAVQEAVAEHGLIFAVDWGARGSATVGGGISTNAGGNRVVRYGMMRDNVLGVEAVLADGTIISSLNTLLKNNAAYDLKQLFIGSEGTLGLITRAVLKLHPAPASENTAIVALDSFGAVLEFFGHCGQRLGGTLTSFEAMWASHYNLMAVESGRHVAPLPAGHPFYIIVEACGADQERDDEHFAAVLAEALAHNIVADAVIAASKAQAAAIWKVREDIEGLFMATQPAVTFDVSLPLTAMEGYVEQVRGAVLAKWGEESRVTVFGHLGDGNLHIIIGPRPWAEDIRHQVEDVVYTPLRDLGGSISAEHGIGMEKRDWLTISRSPEEIALMHSLKAALDPKGLLNPGKVLR